MVGYWRFSSHWYFDDDMDAYTTSCWLRPLEEECPHHDLFSFYVFNTKDHIQNAWEEVLEITENESECVDSSHLHISALSRKNPRCHHPYVQHCFAFFEKIFSTQKPIALCLPFSNWGPLPQGPYYLSYPDRWLHPDPIPFHLVRKQFHQIKIWNEKNCIEKIQKWWRVKSQLSSLCPRKWQSMCSTDVWNNILSYVYSTDEDDPLLKEKLWIKKKLFTFIPRTRSYSSTKLEKIIARLLADDDFFV